MNMKGNDIRKWRDVITDYNLVMDGKHERFKRLIDFYEYYGLTGQTFEQYYEKYRQSEQFDIDTKEKEEEKKKQEKEQTETGLDEIEEVPSIFKKLPYKKIALGLSLVAAVVYSGDYALTQYDLYKQNQLVEEQILLEKQKAWEEAKGLGTKEAYGAYAKAWPDAEEAQVAIAKVEEIIDQEHRNSAIKKEDDIRLRSIQRMLNKLGYRFLASGKYDLHTQVSIKQFQSDHELDPTGRPSAELLSQIKSELIRRDNAAWEEALKGGTVKSIENYLIKHPNGLHSDEVTRAKSNVKKFLKEQEKINAENQTTLDNNAREKDDVAFMTAESINNEESYKFYLDTHPNGRHYEVAKKAYDNIQKNKASSMSQRALIKDIQRELARLTYPNISLSGRNDFNTSKAIKLFERGMKRKQTGRASYGLLSLLISQANKPNHDEGEVIVECPQCPKMVVVPAGSVDLTDDKGLAYTVTIQNSFAVGMYEVSLWQYQACIDVGACRAPEWEDRASSYNRYNGKNRNYYTQLKSGITDGNYPAVGMNWHDAKSYVVWLSQKTKGSYRLLTESEWEYVTRAGSKTNFTFGNEISHEDANYYGQEGWDRFVHSSPIGEFKPNLFGLFDVHGNVSEWVEDCWAEVYDQNHAEGSAYTIDNCDTRVIRGGSWFHPSDFLKSNKRDKQKATVRSNRIGFRVARDVH